MTRARILADYVAGGTTAAEFDYMDGVTSNVQTQMDAKLATATATSTYAPKASPAFTGTPTGITAAHITSGVLPVGVTGGSGLSVGGLKSMQVFTSSGTWTRPSGITTIKVYVTGGGGGASPVNSDDISGGGGAGATAIEIIDVTSVSSVAVTVGAGHAGVANNGSNNEAAGNASSFGGYCTGGGGYTAGGFWGIAGRGGTATGGDINIYGGDGQGGAIDQTSPVYEASGTGGGSFWGQGGRGSTIANASLRAGHAFGSGGGGASVTGTGASGADGIVIVEEYS